MNNFRLSSYVIDVPLKKEQNKHMIIHGYTGAIDIVSKEIIIFLQKNKDKLGQGIFPYSESTWNTLVKRGYITIKTQSEEIDHTRNLAELLHKQSKLIKSFGFVVSYNCNFRCPYCYEGEISNFGKHWNKNQFTKELIDKAYSAFEQIEGNRSLHSNSILLYGGEPLLKENKDIVNYIVKKGSSLGYTFSSITNGYDLNEYKELLSPKKISQIQITIDGWKDTHNIRRIHKDGVNTFDKIIENVKMALEQDIKISIRMNTDYSNFSGIDKLDSYFTKLGFYNYKNFHFYIALMVDYLQENKDEVAKNLNYMSRHEFCKKNANFDNRLNFEDWGIVNRLFKAIKSKSFLSISSIYCSAQSGSYIFDSKEKIYSCWEALGREESIIGDYSKNQILWTPYKEKLQERDISKQEKCYQCKYSFLCRGGCASLSIKKKGDINASFCNDYPHVFETSANKAYDQFMKQQ